MDTQAQDSGDSLDVPFHEWTSCEVHGHDYQDGFCRDCGDEQVQ